MTEKKQRGNPNIKAGPGRPKGVPNKTTQLLKDAILEAATLAGGKEGLVGYLKRQAIKHPGPFLALLGKVLPTQVTGANGGPLEMVDLTKYLSSLTDEQLEALQDAAVAIAANGGTAGADQGGESTTAG